MIFRRLLFYAASWIASNPRVRAKAAEVFEREVKPRAEEAWRKAKPKLDAAKAEIDAAKAEIEDIAREADPRENPRKFAAKLKERLLDRKDRP